MAPVDRDALTSGGFILLIDLTNPLQINTQESPPLTAAEVRQIKTFIQGLIKEMEPGERRKRFELWINPTPPEPGTVAPGKSSLKIQAVRPPKPPGPDFQKIFPAQTKPEDPKQG